MVDVQICVEGEPVTLKAHIVGGLAIHRPVYRYMRGQGLTFLDQGWAVSHLATGGSLTRFAPKGARGESLALGRYKAWAADVQARDPEAWAELDRLPWGPPTQANKPLADRCLAAIRSVEA